MYKLEIYLYERTRCCVARFAAKFKFPVFSDSKLAREVSALQSEKDMYRIQDNWRLQRVIAEIANKSHPYSRDFEGELTKLTLT